MADKKLKTIDIKGKEYVLINERIKYFRETYENGVIKTELLSNENGVCLFKAEIWINEKLIATGHAYERETSSFINKTSYIENCETSAVGRALAIAGIGIDSSIASYEEVANAIKQQEESDKKRLELLAEFNKLVIETDTQKELIYETYKVENNTQMTDSQLEQAIRKMKSKLTNTESE